MNYQDIGREELGSIAGGLQEGFRRSSLPDPSLIPSRYLPVTFLVQFEKIRSFLLCKRCA